MTDRAGAPVVSDAEIAAMIAAFYAWWGENDHALSLGGYGDVVGLWVALNAAKANATNPDSET